MPAVDPPKRREKRSSEPAAKRRRRATEPEVDPSPSMDLSPGDNIELGVTMEVKTNRTSLWIKTGITGTVRPDETGTEAQQRITTALDASMSKMLSDFDAT